MSDRVAMAEQRVLVAARALGAELLELATWRAAVARPGAAHEIALIIELCEGHVAAARREMQVAALGLLSVESGSGGAIDET